MMGVGLAIVDPLIKKAINMKRLSFFLAILVVLVSLTGCECQKVKKRDTLC